MPQGLPPSSYKMASNLSVEFVKVCILHVETLRLRGVRLDEDVDRVGIGGGGDLEDDARVLVHDVATLSKRALSYSCTNWRTAAFTFST